MQSDTKYENTNHMMHIIVTVHIIGHSMILLSYGMCDVKLA